MSKKKPTSKRLENLFGGLEPETTSAETKQASRKSSEKDKIASLHPGTVEPSAPPASRPKQITSPATRSEKEISLAFDAGKNTWATLQVIDDSQHRGWDSDDELLVRQVTDQLSLALQNAHLFQETQRRAQESSALAEVGREILATLDLHIILEKIANYAKDLLNAETSAVYIPAEDKATLYPIAVIGKDVDQIKNDPLKVGSGILGTMAVSKQGEIANYVARDSRAVTIRGTADATTYEHLMGVPVLLQDRVTGVMAVWRVGTGREFTQTEFGFLTSLAQQTAIAIENARLFDEVTTSQGQLSDALRIARIGYFEIDVHTATITCTDELFDLLHTTAKEEGGYQLPLMKAVRRFVLEEDIPSLIKSYREATNSKTTDEIISEVRYRSRDGNILWVSSTFKVERDSNQRAVRVAGSSQDVTDRKTNELTQAAISHIAEGALSAVSVRDLIRIVHEAVATLMPARDFYVAMYDEETDSVSFPYYQNEHGSSPAQPHKQLTGFLAPQKPGKGLTSYVLRTGQPLLCTPEVYSDLERAGLVEGENMRKTDWLGVPLKRGTQRYGVMALRTYTTEVRLTEQDRDKLMLLAEQVSIALERMRSREALAKSEANLRALFASMQDVVFVVDKDTRYTYIAPTNPSRLFRPPQDLLGRRMDDILPAENHEPFRRAIRQALETNEGVQIEYQLPVEGQMFWFLANLTKLNDHEVFWVARDITERKKSEESLQRRNTYLAVSAEIGRLVTSTLDLNTIFAQTTRFVTERFGFYYTGIYNIEETGSNALLRGAAGEAAEKMLAARHSVIVGSLSVAGKVAESGKPLLVDDVSTEPLFLSNPLLPETKSQAVIPLRVNQRTVGLIDIQSRDTHAFTEDDISVLQSLGDQVAIAIDNARSYELSQELIKDLREVDKLKSQFLANMSHELRTPLNSIIGFSRVILKGIDGPTTDMQQQDLTAIYNSGQHLLGLINDILDLARIEAGKMELNFEEVNISEMVNSVLSTAKGLVKEKPIQLVPKIPVGTTTVRGDAMRIRQVLINLLSNASKFTDEGSITVEAVNQTSPMGVMEVLINVHDTGPGISLEDQEKLFKAFSQVDGSATRKTGGSGLGLSICANLVQLHGGRIGVTSTEGSGSTFWFTVPSYHQPMPTVPAGKKLVIAIDDDPKVINLYDRYLSPQGYHLIPFTNTADAKARIIALKPHVITLDVMMPNTDGWTLLSDLRADPATRHIPVIICSIIDEKEKGMKLGASDYLTKPILEEDLVAALNRLEPAVQKQ